MVFDLCLCARSGAGASRFYRTTVALVPGVKAKFRTGWVDWASSPATLSLALLMSTMGLALQPWYFWEGSSEMTRHSPGMRSGTQ